MKLFRKLRERSRSKRSQVKKQVEAPTAAIYANSYKGPDLASTLPSNVLANIFSYVCPHTQDDSYATCEESTTEDGCGLCDARDLAHCVQVCKNWTTEAQQALYRNVRLDAVHYCSKEDKLAEKRRRKSSLFDHSVETRDPAQIRLELFANTVKLRIYLGNLVETLKVPYMTRETCKADLARAVSALSNLRYVDLPEGLFSDDHSALLLREELRHSCHELRRMKYATGSEESFAQLPESTLWRRLEILELQGLAIEPELLLYGLASFPSLREVKLQNIESLDDIIFSIDTQLPLFPPLATLHISGHSHFTTAGLQTYLSQPEVVSALKTFSLIETNLPIKDLHILLVAATSLKAFTVRQTVTHSLTNSHNTSIPPLASQSLTTLHYEIIPASTISISQSQTLTATHYTYLTTSLLSSSLPLLTSLYTYNPHLPYLLLSFSNSPPSLASLTLNPRASFFPPRPRSSYTLSDPSVPDTTTLPSTSPLSSLSRPLHIYTKPSSFPETEWSLTTIHPPSAVEGRKGSISATRPLSMLPAPPHRSSSYSPYPYPALSSSPSPSPSPAGFAFGFSQEAGAKRKTSADANGLLSVPGQGARGDSIGRDEGRRRSGVAFAEIVGGFKRGSFSSAGSGSGSGDGRVEEKERGRGRKRMSRFGGGGGEWMGSE